MRWWPGNYPDDPRNRQAVAALRALAEYILALEPDDSRLVHLRDSAEHARQLDSYVPETGEACGNWGRTLGSYGFYQDCTPEEGLRKLTGASDKDDAEWAALGGDVLAEVTRSVARSLGFAGQGLPQRRFRRPRRPPESSEGGDGEHTCTSQPDPGCWDYLAGIER